MIFKDIPQIQTQDLKGLLLWAQKITQMLKLFSNSNLQNQVLAPGLTVVFDGALPLPGWFFFDGQLLNIADDRGLWQIYGNTYSLGGDPADTFRLPTRTGPYTDARWMVKR